MADFQWYARERGQTHSPWLPVVHKANVDGTLLVWVAPVDGGPIRTYANPEMKRVSG